MELNNPSDIVKILDRIKKRLDNPDEDINILSKYVSDRAEVERQYADMLSKIIPQKYDERNPVMKLLVQDMRLEISQHRALQGQLEQLIPSYGIFTKQFVPRSKELQRQISNCLADLNSKWTTVQKHRKWISDARAKLDTLPLNKRPSQEKYIQNLCKNAEKPEYQFKSCQEQVLSSFSSDIYTQYTEFEKARIAKTKEFGLGIILLKSASHDKTQNLEKRNCENLASMDLEDRASLYVSRLINPKLDNVYFDDEIDVFCYAIEDFSANGDSTLLSFERGDKIRVIKRDKSGWNLGELKNKKGYYPSNFTIDPKVAEQESIPLNCVCVAKDEYKKKKDLFDIDIRVGDIISVEAIVSVREKKCAGYNYRTKMHGFFPFSVLDFPDTDL